MFCGKICFLIVTLGILLLTTMVSSRPEPEPKPGFLGGVIGGAVGSIIGKNIKTHKSDHSKHYYEIPSTTIQRGVTLANGCYKQTVREPDTFSPGKYIETEQMICPPNVQASLSGVMPQQSVQSPMAPIPTNGPVMMTPLAPSANQPQIMVLSKKIGSYRNNANSLMQTGFVALIALALSIQFI